MGIQEFRVLDNPRFPAVTDGLYHGRLQVESRFDFGVAVTFDDLAALRRYYGHQVHAQERRRLYCTLNQEVEALYAEADGLLAIPKEGAKVAGIFERIEELMRPWILRIDLHEDFSGLRLVSRRPPGNVV